MNHLRESPTRISRNGRARFQVSRRWRSFMRRRPFWKTKLHHSLLLLFLCSYFLSSTTAFFHPPDPGHSRHLHGEVSSDDSDQLSIQPMILSDIVGKNVSRRSSTKDEEDASSNDRHHDSSSSNGNGGGTDKIWKDVKNECGCWNSSSDDEHREVECKCDGRGMRKLPADLPPDVYRITVAESSSFVQLGGAELRPYRRSLREIILSDLPSFAEINDATFAGMEHLNTIYIHDTPSLHHLPHNVFTGYLPKLKLIKIHHSSLRKVPNFSQLELSPNHLLHTLDLENNKITTITPGWIQNLKVDYLALSYNRIEEIGPNSFQGASIARLTLKGNRRLKTLHPHAFVGINNLLQLDLSETSITQLPTLGLKHIESLRLENVFSLTVIPSIYHFQDLQEAWMTFPFHCCAFAFPDRHDPHEYGKYKEFISKMEETNCQAAEHDRINAELNTQTVVAEEKKAKRESTHARPGPEQEKNGHSFMERNSGSISPLPRVKRSRFSTSTQLNISTDANDLRTTSNSSSSIPLHALPAVNTTSLPPNAFDEFNPYVFDPDKDFAPSLDPKRTQPWVPNEDRKTNSAEGQADEFGFGMFHESVPTPPSIIKLCGNITVKKPSLVRCKPLPDAFSPCEDIMGNLWLRTGVWIVVALALIGNTAVLVVLIFAPSRMSVQRFLMANLSLADLCMGLYLLMVASEDLVSLGSYFNYAIEWQQGWGCQVAGFFTVFASELSVFTLAVITGERWYALTRAMHLTKRLTITGAAELMTVGWILSILLAVLPLVGVSSYSKTSICLPMEASTTGSQWYLTFLLLFNGVSFFMVALAYWQMYRAVASHGSAATSAHIADAAVAKKMALLVFTDFACWAPVAFFGLTAVAGHPLIGITDSKILLVFFYPLNACCNPYLYAILTKQYRRDLLLLLSSFGDGQISPSHGLQNTQLHTVRRHTGAGSHLQIKETQAVVAAHNSQQSLFNVTGDCAKVHQDNNGGGQFAETTFSFVHSPDGRTVAGSNGRTVNNQPIKGISFEGRTELCP